MGCIVEFSEPLLRFNFCQNKNKQKTWLDILLKYSALDLAGLASLIEVSVQALQDVLSGIRYLEDEPAIILAQFFLIFFSD